MSVLFDRRSIRKYKSDMVPREVLEQIVAAGKMAPSAMNQQRYHITVVTSAEKIQVLGGLVKQEMLSNPNLPPHVRERLEGPDFSATNGAPVVILVSKAEGPLGPMDSAQDAALVCENLMLEARVLEVGSCWMGAFSHMWNIPGAPETLRSDFGIPEGYELYAGIVFGYPDGGFPDTPRARREDNVNWVE